MADFYVKVPDDKIDFFKELVRDLGYENEHLKSTNETDVFDMTDDEDYFLDDDD